MAGELDKKLKTALDENRLLILGAQVLLGFQFECFFQDGFSELSPLMSRRNNGSGKAGSRPSKWLAVALSSGTNTVVRN
jgi:hypothetical protein